MKTTFVLNAMSLWYRVRLLSVSWADFHISNDGHFPVRIESECVIRVIGGPLQNATGSQRLRRVLGHGPSDYLYKSYG